MYCAYFLPRRDVGPTMEGQCQGQCIFARSSCTVPSEPGHMPAGIQPPPGLDLDFGCLVVWLVGCLVVWLIDCLVVRLFGCLVGRLFGCSVARLGLVATFGCVSWLFHCSILFSCSVVFWSS